MSMLIPQQHTSFRPASAFSPYSGSASCDFLLLRTESVTAAGSLESQPGSARPMLTVLVPQASASFHPAAVFSPALRGEPPTPSEASKGDLPDGLNRMGSFTAEQLAAFG